MRKRFFVLLLSVLALAATSVGVFVATSTTEVAARSNHVADVATLGENLAMPQQRAPSTVSRHIVTWNMQGANHSTENKWQLLVANLLRTHRMVFLQEAGAVPHAAQHVRDVDVNGWTVKEYAWGSTTRPSAFIYWLETDPGGNRVHLAVVSRDRADAVDAVIGPNRPALGIRVGGAYYFSVHASARNHGGDARSLLHNIDSAVADHEHRDAADYSWFALGDYNREPWDGGLAFVVCPPNSPTWPATDPRKYYDYMVRDFGDRQTGVVLDLQFSDHLPDQFDVPPIAAQDTDARGKEQPDDDTDARSQNEVRRPARS